MNKYTFALILFLCLGITFSELSCFGQTIDGLWSIKQERMGKRIPGTSNYTWEKWQEPENDDEMIIVDVETKEISIGSWFIDSYIIDSIGKEYTDNEGHPCISIKTLIADGDMPTDDEAVFVFTVTKGTLSNIIAGHLQIQLNNYIYEYLFASTQD